MSLYVLDTDILSLYQHGHPKVIANVSGRQASELAITVISVDETLSGWYTLVRRMKKPDEIAKAYAKLANAVRFLAIWSILDYTETAVSQYQSLIAMKLGVRGNDLRIAAIVLENAAVLVTRNTSDFQRVPGLTIEDWSV